MSISCLYNERVDVARMTAILDEEDEPTSKKELTTHLENVKCYIQALDDDTTKDITNGFGKEWKMFCDVLDIQEGDRIIRNESGENQYRVVGAKTYNGPELNTHMEIRIRAFKS